MIDADTLAELKDWVKGGRRQAEIQLGNPLSPDYENIHVFDADLNEGQDVRSVAEINLIARKRRKIEGLKKRIEKLELANYNPFSMIDFAGKVCGMGR